MSNAKDLPPASKTDVGKGAQHASDWVALNPGADRKTVIGAALDRGRAIVRDGGTKEEALAYVTDFRTAAGHPYDSEKDSTANRAAAAPAKKV